MSDADEITANGTRGSGEINSYIRTHRSAPHVKIKVTRMDRPSKGNEEMNEVLRGGPRKIAVKVPLG